MRTLATTTLETALYAPSYRSYVRATVDPSRTYFSTLTDDYAFDTADYTLMTSTPTGQCMVFDASSSKTKTFIVDGSALKGMTQGSSSKTTISGITIDGHVKPAAWYSDTGIATLWWWNGSAMASADCTLSDFSIGGISTNSVDCPSGWTKGDVSFIAVSATQVVALYQTSKGGIGVSYYNGSSWNVWSHRFISPKTVTTDYWPINSAAAILGNYLFVYITDMDTGEVTGIRYDIPNDLWDDTFVALPADLTRFDVSNAIVSCGHIHMAGQFHRTDDVAGAQKYSQVLRSSDGYTFSWDRFTLLSRLGYKFHIALDDSGKKVYASDRNRVSSADASIFFETVPTNRVILAPPGNIISYSLSNNDSATLKIKAADELYYTHATIAKGNRVLVELGFQTTAGIEYTEIGKFIIDTKSILYEDGKRSVELGLIAEGVWKTNQIAFPYYAEINGKPSLFDDCDKKDNLYPAPGSAKTTDQLVVDFWNSTGWASVTYGTTDYSWKTASGAGCEHKVITGSYAYGMQTEELTSGQGLSAYPEFISTISTVSVYGWARTSDTSRENDTVIPYLIIQDTESVESIIAGTKLSTYNVFPQEYPDTENGSLPIVYSFTGLTAGNELKRIALKVSNTEATYDSDIAFERVKIEGTSHSFSALTLEASKGWTQSKPSSFSTTDETVLELNTLGIASVLFATKPYAAFKFCAYGDFEYEAGTEPLTVGTLGWGVVGIAEDGSNLIIGRFNLATTVLEIVKLRNGEETQLAHYDLTPGTIPLKIMMEHRDGCLYLRRYLTDTWLEPEVTYHWDEVTHGAMSTSATAVMHVGSYACKIPPGFRIPSYNIQDGIDGIATLAGEDHSAITAMPASGKVQINNSVYKYGSKSALTPEYGPVCARNTGNYGSYTCGEDGATFDGTGVEIGLYHPNNEADYLTDLLVSSDNGHTWKITQSEWHVVHSNAGVPNPLRNRSRHYGIEVKGNYVGTNSRMNISPGLLAIENPSGEQGAYHPRGEWCFLYGTDKIWLKNFMGTVIDKDVTIKDMISVLCKVASIEPSFPGDLSGTASVSSGGSIEIGATKELFPGGYDLTFTCNADANDAILVRAENLTFNGYMREFGVKKVSNKLVLMTQKEDHSDDTYIETGIPWTDTATIRVLMHANFVSFYFNNIYAGIFGYDDLDVVWPVTAINMFLTSLSGIYSVPYTITELFDWRESTFVESEVNASGAISSVIQERPVEIAPTATGGLSYSYEMVREVLELTVEQCKNVLRRHESQDITGQDAGSDAIIYFKDIAFSTDEDFADTEGFVTRVLKLSNLDYGADIAGKMVLRKANQRQHQEKLNMRPDPRPEVGDIIVVNYTASGTGTTIEKAIIIESVSMNIGEMNSIMQLSGRATDVPA